MTISNLNKYLGVPFEEHGRTVEGVDCWGLVVMIYEREWGMRLPGLSGYGSTRDRERISEIIEGEKMRWERVEEPEIGDVVVIDIGGVPCHVGMYVGGKMMIHAMKNVNSCVERLTSIKWKNRINGYYRKENG